MTALLLMLLAAVPAGEKGGAKPNTLTAKEIADGWVLLFDGETTFGWKVEGEVKVTDGLLVIGGTKKSSLITTTGFLDYDLAFECLPDGKGAFHPGWQARTRSSLQNWHLSSGTWRTCQARVRGSEETDFFEFKNPTGGGGKQGGRPVGAPKPWGVSRVVFAVDAGCKVSLRNVRLRPVGLKSIFNGKDLTGWKEIPGKKSKFSVTKEGWLNVKDGPGDLQTEGKWADFVLQLDCISNGKHLNSGVFFRCLPGEFWSGYEAQIRNQWEGERTRPVDFGTGGLYGRQPARKVVSSDKEWFTMTVVSEGKHIAIWVNGYQTVDFTDAREAAGDARRGAKADAGPVSLQGHDPTTDLSFRNIRIADLKAAKSP